MGPEESPAVRGLSRIIIADDHPLFRSAIRQTLEKNSSLEVVGEAANGRQALELCHRLRPDLVLMDLRMPEMDGIAATHAIKRELPETLVLILTALDESAGLSEAQKEGGPAGSSTAERPLGERAQSRLGGSLTPREVEVLRLVVHEQTNQQIARAISVSVSTVKRHIRHISEKLGVSDRVQAAVRAVELGVLDERDGG